MLLSSRYKTSTRAPRSLDNHISPHTQRKCTQHPNHATLRVAGDQRLVLGVLVTLARKDYMDTPNKLRRRWGRQTGPSSLNPYSGGVHIKVVVVKTVPNITTSNQWQEAVSTHAQPRQDQPFSPRRQPRTPTLSGDEKIRWASWRMAS